jgi:DNA repair protein SbcC/Rad50
VDDVEWGEFALADGAADGPAFDWSGRSIRRRTVPDPGGRDHDDYGALLHVPAFDPWVEGAGRIHLWYLVDDVHALHDLLALGIDRYGKLKEFARLGGTLPVDPAVVEQADRTARLCRRFGELWRQGRPRPVDRAVLEDSGAISDTFMDRVADLCDELDGCGEALVEALEGGDLPRFRAASAEELRDYLLEHGYIRQDEPLDDDTIRLKLVAELGSGGGAGVGGGADDGGDTGGGDPANLAGTDETVSRLIRRLRHGAGG